MFGSPNYDKELIMKFFDDEQELLTIAKKVRLSFYIIIVFIGMYFIVVFNVLGPIPIHSCAFLSHYFHQQFKLAIANYFGK